MLGADRMLQMLDNPMVVLDAFSTKCIAHTQAVRSGSVSNPPPTSQSRSAMLTQMERYVTQMLSNPDLIRQVHAPCLRLLPPVLVAVIISPLPCR